MVVGLLNILLFNCGCVVHDRYFIPWVLCYNNNTIISYSYHPYQLSVTISSSFPHTKMQSICLLICGLVLASYVKSNETSNLRRNADEVVELSSSTELESSDSSAKTTMPVIMVSFFNDNMCKMAASMPFIWIASAKCVPNEAATNSYMLTVSGSGVMANYYSDMSCMMPTPNAYNTYSATQCVASPIATGSYMTVKAMNIPMGSLPSGPQLGTYYVVFTTDAACKAFSATASNPVANIVVAQPFSYIGQSAGSPFGVSFNAAQALSCSNDGTSAVLTYWKTQVGKTGALTVASTTPAGSQDLPMVMCQPLGYGPSSYSFRSLCI